MKDISLMNPITFYEMWEKPLTKKFLENIIKEVINKNEEYNLLETFNKDCMHLRSYIFLESSERIVFIDFNKYKNNTLLYFDLELVDYLKLIYDKEIILIMFNSFNGKNKYKDNVYQIYINNKNSDDLNYFLNNKDNKNEKIDAFIKKLDDRFYNHYLKEEKKLENICNSANM